MHGRFFDGEERIPRRHMWPVPVLGTTTLAADTSDSSISSVTSDSFLKDGRKIRVGDCALFKPLQDTSPPFIGIIRRLMLDKENFLNLGVNWLYRPADVQLAKGGSVEAAPNEIFYSFHKDQASAASLLHPCKVAFLRKGADLPPGISSFVCRRVYDTSNHRLYWLTDRDYTNERQEEVDQLLDKSRLEMHAAVQSGGRSPKPLNGPSSTQTLKPGSDGAQNSTNAFSSQVKQRKRDRGEQGSESVKRERPTKIDDVNSAQFRLEGTLKSEIAKITDKGVLVDFEGVQKFVHLMQPDRSEKRLDVAGRTMLADVIAATEKDDCLTKFVQLRGLSVLDEWLQEVHKGKSGDGSITREMDKSVEDFLFALLRALDRLPVDLHALQNCNVGKSVNNLRTHKNLEIQKKARGLVDTWKKRVEAEMNMNDSKPGSNQTVSWPNKAGFTEVNHGGSRRTGLSEAHMKNLQPSASKVTTVKVGHGDSSSKLTSSSIGSVKSPSLSAPVAIPRDSPCKIPVGSSASDVPLSTIKEEKSSGSSQSQNNSQSCSSDHAKHVGSLWKEDARSSTAGSLNPGKTSTSATRHRKSSNGTVGSSVSGASKESTLVKCGSVDKKSMSEKAPQAGLACERTADVPPMDNGNNHRLIVRLPNLGRSPARSANGSSLDDPSTVASRGSPRFHERHDHFDRKVKAKTDCFRPSIAAPVDKESRHKNGAKGEGDKSPASLLDDEHDRTLEEVGKMVETSKVTLGNHKGNSPNDPKPGKSHEASFRSINVLIESCVKYSESMPSMPAGDDRGMNLLASVAAGEMVKSEHVSPSGSPQRSMSAQEESQSKYDGKRLHTEESVVHGQPNDSDDNNVSNVGLVQVKGEESHGSVLDTSSSKILEDCRSSTFAEEKPTGENSEGRIHEVSTSEKKESTDEGINNRRADIPCGNADGAGAEVLNPLEEISSGTKADCADEKMVHNGIGGTASELGCGVDATGVKNVKEGVGDSVLCVPSENHGKSNNVVHDGPSDGLPTEHKLTCKVEGATECSEHSSASGNDMITSNVDEKVQFKQNDSKRNENDLVVSDHNNDVQNSPERKDDKTQAREAVENDQSEECVSTAGGSSRSDGGGKLDFDLNEGFPADEGIQGEPIATVAPAYSAHGSLPFLPTMSNGLPLVPVAAAAKGPFVPPENMLKSTGEIGWRGSAATSAFRPAEPRKVLEMQLTPDTMPNKQVQARPPLDIDLNEPDDRFQDDLSLQCAAQPAPSASSVLNLHDYKGIEIGIGSSRSVGGLDLDLNKVDEDTDTSQIPTSSGRRFEALSVKQQSAAEVNVLRNFDLNNGPGFDETGLEQQPIQRHHHHHHHQQQQQQQHIKSSVPFLPTVGGIRMSNNAEFGSLSSWFPPGNSYPAVAIPSILPDRGEQQAYPVVSTTGSQRILGPPTAGISFGPDGYRGPVLSSSPAVAFPPGTQFPYPGFPFGTNFPLPTTSFSSGYLDSSSTGGLVFPAAVPSQLPTHYPRPYVLSLPDGSANGGGLESNRRWVRQGLDLNAGPVGPSDIEGSSLPSASRQLASSHTLAEEQMRMYQAAGAAALKRKEPEGGWDTDRFSYKQNSWQ